MGGCCSSSSSAYERIPLHNDMEDVSRPQARRAKAGNDDVTLAARFYLRSKPGMSLDAYLQGIGQRPRKHMFSVKANGAALLMTMVEKPRECALALDTEHGRFVFEQIMTGLKSHFVYPTIAADYVEDKRMAVVFREVQPKGSLRDLLFQAKWSRTFDEKYATKRGTPFSETRIATWGRHILEGIMALRVKGFPAGHVHTGNVIVDNNICRITDYENKLLNLKPCYMALMQLPALVGRGVDPDVVCFGAILFEMCTGFIMDTVDVAQPPAGVAPSLAPVLAAIFYSQGTAPTLEQLVSSAPFSTVQMPDLAPLPRARLGARAKEALQEARRVSLVSGSDVKKPPRPPSKPQRYTDTPLSTVGYSAAAAKPTATAVAKPAEAVAAAPPRPVAPAAATSAVAAAAPPPPPAAAPKVSAPASAPPPPPPGPPPPKRAEAPGGRGGLLNSIEGFKLGGLRKTVTVDKSKPILSSK